MKESVEIEREKEAEREEWDLRMHSGWAPLQVRSVWHIRVVEPNNRWPL